MASYLCLVCCAACFSGFSTASETVSLEALIQTAKAQPAETSDPKPLSRHWVGSIREHDGSFTAVRLEKGMVDDGAVQLFSIEPDGSLAVGDSPTLVSRLPSRQHLEACQSFAILSKMLGDHGRAGFEKWVGPNGEHSRKIWVSVAQAPAGQLVMMIVRVELSQSEEDGTHIEKLEISRGYLRQADPKSDIDSLMFSSNSGSQRSKLPVSLYGEGTLPSYGAGRVIYSGAGGE